MQKSLAKKIKNMPKKPGVYLFFAKGESASGGKDSRGRILYIGKARDLKKRVQTHFAKTGNFFSSQFIEKISDIDWIKTENEKQALILENQLIKKYRPRYNIQWRDDKSYFWVIFSEDKWPRVEVVHQNKFKIKNLKLKINGIGPFVSGRELRRVLRVLRKIIPFRTCKNAYGKPCLQWHLGLCPAHSLNLKFKIKNLKLRNNYLNSLNTISQFLRLYAGEKIRIEAYDISNIQGKYATGSMIVFYGDKPSKSDYRKFRIKTVKSANDIAMLKEVLKRRLGHPEWPYPDLMLIDGGIAQLNAAKLIINHYSLNTILVALAKREEEIYTGYSVKPLKIRRLPESLRIAFQHIRDEAHRFAIFYYRYLHEARDFRRIRKTVRKAS